MHPAVAPRPDGELSDTLPAVRDAVREALARLAGAEVLLLLACDDTVGDGAAIRLAARAGLDGYGAAGTTAPLRVAEEAAGAVADATGWPITRGAALATDPAVLALQAAAVLDTPVVPVGHAPGAGPRALADALVRADLDDAAVVAAGDLSACLGPDSPRPGVPGGDAFDRAAVAALRDGDTAAFEQAGHEEAGRVHARGWAVLGALLRVVGRPPTELTYEPLAGVGQVVATWEPA